MEHENRISGSSGAAATACANQQRSADDGQRECPDDVRPTRCPGYDEQGNAVTAKAMLAERIRSTLLAAGKADQLAKDHHVRATCERTRAADLRLQVFHLQRSLETLNAADPLGE